MSQSDIPEKPVNKLIEKRISVIIPNYNMASTIGKCLEAAINAHYANFEVVVVDDCSDDASVALIQRYPCRLIQLPVRGGASKARNIGAKESTGDILFFIDADCLIQRQSLSQINKAFSASDSECVIGGTYTKSPYDNSFFSTFQSLYVYYTETKKAENPDYVAAHAMVMSKKTFEKGGGFPEKFLPIIEDVEFSHRLRDFGVKLMMKPDIQVQHIFNFTFWKSLHNAFRKTAYWCMYSLKNRDLLTDSGASSTELKMNVMSFALAFCLLVIMWAYSSPVLLTFIAVIVALNVITSRRLIKTFYDSQGSMFAVTASLYYILIYPLPVGVGTIAGTIRHLINR